MTVKIEARADARALTGGLLLGAAVGLALGGAYVAGGLARTADSQPRAARLAAAAAQGFSESALRAETLTMDPGALALAQKHDPVTAQAAGLRVAHASVVTPPTTTAPHPMVMRVAYETGPAARPFHFASGALQSARDLDCLTDAVYYEARGETAAGQAAVAQVVLNRVRHPAFPKSVCGVVFQGVAGDGCQFSFACDGSMHRPREAVAWKRAEQISARALAGFVMPSVGNATHFHVIGLDPGWGPRLLRVAQIGLHVFYRFGGYAGAPSNFNGEARPTEVADASPGAHPAYPDAGVTADGRPAGQIILASATMVAPGQGGSQAVTATESPAAKAQPQAEPSTAKADDAAKSRAGAGL